MHTYLAEAAVLHTVGLLYAVMTVLLLVCSFMRSRYSDLAYSDAGPESGSESTRDRVVRTKGHEGKRILGPPFVTAGWVALGVFLTVLGIEVALLVLILTIELPGPVSV